MAEGRMDRRKALRLTAVAGVSSIFGGSMAAAIARDARLHRVRETRTRMGTMVTLTTIHPDVDDARAMLEAGFHEMARLEAVLSRHRPSAALGRLNASGRLDDAPADLVSVLEAALTLARATGGAFDPTVLPLLEAHRRSFERDGRPAGAEARRAALALVDHRGVSIEGASVVFEAPHMAVTLDGIAKGYVVDRTVDVLLRRGADRVLVDAGGDMAAGGPGSEREPWRIAVQDPAEWSGQAGLARLGARGIATSGDYLNSFTTDRRHHQILDPRTGRSPEDVSSVSVIAPSAMWADALSTAVMVLGVDEGLALLAARGEVEGLLVTKTGQRHQTDGFGT